ncbi:MAG TPA: hypothetical protein PLV72_03685 [Candidatus Magasanikbacteria bacterium]|nr:hypothetical protein [Candidatus Magasanikbacteria bacterium]
MENSTNPTQPQTQPAPTNQNPQPVGAHKNTGMAIVAYIIFFIPLLTNAKNDPFVKFHVKQGLLIFITSIILWVFQMALPWRVLFMISWIFSLMSLALLVLMIIGIVNAANGKEEKLPLIGHFADKFKF